MKQHPWYDWQEWFTVYNHIYAKDSVEQDRALGLIDVWRVRGQLPHAVDMTSQLIQVCVYMCIIYGNYI